MSFDPSITSFLKEHVLFRDYANDKFIAILASSMKTRVFADGAFVIRKGEVGRALFFVLRGIIEVISEDGETILNNMKDGSFFGEIGVLYSVPRTASCRSNGRSILLVLTKETLEKVLEPYPKIARGIARIAEERYAAHMKQTDESLQVEFGEELALGLTHQDLNSVPLFRDCEVGFLHNLALSLVPLQFEQGQIIFRKGDPSSSMYFVVKGRVVIFNEETQAIYAEFLPGSFFGEVGLLFNLPRTASVRAVEPKVKLFSLSKTDMDQVLKKYPEVKQKIEKEASQRLVYIEARENAKLSPIKLRETELEVVREKLKSIQLFRTASLAFMHDLALVSKVKTYIPNEIIIRKDQLGRSMFFVLDGIVAVVSEDRATIFAQLQSGACFGTPSLTLGEVSLFYEVNRTATIIAQSESTLLEISDDAVKQLLTQYSDIQEEVLEKARENYEIFLARQKQVELVTDGQNTSKEAYGIEATVMRLRKVSLFQKCDDGFLKMLALKTQLRQYVPSQIVVHRGEPSLEMYFVMTGTLQIVSDDDPPTIFDTLRAGSFFGEIGVIHSTPRVATVKAIENCDLIVLSKATIQRGIREYPEYFHMVMLEAEKRTKLAEARSTASLARRKSTMVSAEQPKSAGVSSSRLSLTATPSGSAFSLASSMTGPFRTPETVEPPVRLSTISKGFNESKDSIADPDYKRGMRTESNTELNGNTLVTTDLPKEEKVLEFQDSHCKKHYPR